MKMNKNLLNTKKEKTIMKKATYSKAFKYSTMVLCLGLLLFPEFMFADVSGEISKWKATARNAAKALIGLAAIGGGVYTFFKMQTDDGSSGKKQLLTYIGALIFAALMFVLIDEIIK